MQPLITVGLQAYNCENTIGATLRSILEQSFDDWELIVHDDGSRDQTLEIVRSFTDRRIRVFHDRKNRRRAFRLNESIAHARGAFYAVADADDVCYPDRLELQVRHLRSNPTHDLVGGQMMVFGANGGARGQRLYPIDHDTICARPTSGIRIGHPTVMARTEWLRKWGYAREMSRSEDQDLLLRAYRESRFANLPETIVGYREDRLNIRKTLRERRWFVRALVRHCSTLSDRRLLVRAVTLQGVKALVEVGAIALGLQQRLLRHRALPVDEVDRQRWASIWRNVTADQV